MVRIESLYNADTIRLQRVNLHLTKRKLAAEKCLTTVSNCCATSQIKRQSKSVLFVNSGYVTNKANRSFDIEAIRNLPSQEFRFSGFKLIRTGTINPFSHSGYYMYHVAHASSKTLYYAHIINSRSACFAQQTKFISFLFFFFVEDIPLCLLN